MLRVIDSLSSLYQDWSQLRAQGSVKNSSVALQEFCVCGVMRLVVARAAWRCTESMGRYVSWRMFSCCSAGSKVEGDAQLADVTQGSARWRCSLQCRVCTCAHAAEPFTNERRKDLQGGAAVFNVECAHAAEPFTNERCSVIGFTYVVGARTHTRKDSQSSPSCWWNGYKQRTQVPRCLGGIFRSHRAAAGCMPVP